MEMENFKELGSDETYDCLHGARTLVIVSGDRTCPVPLDADWAELSKELKLPENYRPYDSAVFGYKNGPAPEAPERKPDLITYIR
ncbi:hypothetical protein [Methanocella arvoryzae]|nr:hypothetical protein [Methanocella arvoryzae]